MTQKPSDDALSDSTNQWMDWATTSLNAIINQSLTGQGFGALSNPTVNPASSQIISEGSRAASLTTNFGSVSSANSITIYWDGTNGSTVLRIYRDDNTVAGPFPGSQAISGLTPSTTYFFYPYFDETTQTVKFVSVPPAVGTPPIAYTAAMIAVAQQQILRGRIALASNLAVTGVATTAAGTGAPVNAGGGGAGGGTFLGSRLSL